MADVVGVRDLTEYLSKSTDVKVRIGSKRMKAGIPAWFRHWNQLLHLFGLPSAPRLGTLSLFRSFLSLPHSVLPHLPRDLHPLLDLRLLDRWVPTLVLLLFFFLFLDHRLLFPLLPLLCVRFRLLLLRLLLLRLLLFCLLLFLLLLPLLLFSLLLLRFLRQPPCLLLPFLLRFRLLQLTELPLLSFCHLSFCPQPILPFQQDPGPSFGNRLVGGCGHSSGSGSGGSGEGGRKFFLVGSNTRTKDGLYIYGTLRTDLRVRSLRGKYCHVTFSPCLTPIFCCSDQSRPTENNECRSVVTIG